MEATYTHHLNFTHCPRGGQISDFAHAKEAWASQVTANDWKLCARMLAGHMVNNDDTFTYLPDPTPPPLLRNVAVATR